MHYVFLFTEYYRMLITRNKMAHVLNIFKSIRNNWKKSIVGTTIFLYSVSNFVNTYQVKQIMRDYCEEASVYGDQCLSTNLKAQHVTVILNPVANKRKAKKLFEKYCEPLLHLAGFAITIIQTESENQARNIFVNLNTHTDIILVAGGDGTLSDVITGIMRKCNKNITIVKQCPIGILPLGENNKVACSLFHEYNDLIEIRTLIDATMAVIRGKTKFADIMEVKLLEKDIKNYEETVYAIGTVEWGPWKDAFSRMDNYWYWGSIKKYVTFIFNGLKNDLNWDCSGIIRYTDPCKGCSKCYKIKNTSKLEGRWWYPFVPKVNQLIVDNSYKDYSRIINKNCGLIREISFSTSEFCLITQNISQVNQFIPSIKIELGPERINYTDFVTEGWRRVNGKKTLINKTFLAKDIEIYPLNSNNFVNKERRFYIDSEEFELKSVKFTLLPEAVPVFCL